MIANRDERQWRDLAYCLSLLNFSERSFLKLNENLICFADKLCCDFVHNCIQIIIANVRKIANAKNETKQLIDEFEQKVNECCTKGVNEDDSEYQKVVGTPPSAAKRQSKLHSTSKRAVMSSKRKGTQPNKSKRKAVSKGSEEEDTDDEVSSNKRVASGSQRKERPQRGAKKQLPIISSDEEDSSS